MVKMGYEMYNLVHCILLVLVVAVVTDAVPLNCTVDQFHCSSGFVRTGEVECIPHGWRCDGEADCADGSDESDCNEFRKVCIHNDFACKDGHSCIPQRWKCDGEADCTDKSDEDDCGNFTCRDNQFQCTTRKQGGYLVCIPEKWKCDGQKDCPDGSDEEGCPIKVCDLNLEFDCGHGQCIFSRWVCDHDADCIDKSDEKNCNFSTCQPDQFSCTDGRCIPSDWRCDGDKDCRDLSDETNCTQDLLHQKRPCNKEYEWPCADGRCILAEWRCDGLFECEDQSDEKNCSITCGEDHWHCKDKKTCIKMYEYCDGIKQCPDGSDEVNCEQSPPLKHCNKTTQFDCGDGSCIPKEKLCDHHPDCLGEEDELPKYKCPSVKERKTCGSNNGDCDHFCHDTPAGRYCSCKSGYYLSEDETHCKDADECLIRGTCSQICHNSVGSYHCKCYNGYILQGDGKSCRAVGNHPKLLVSDRLNIRQYDLISQLQPNPLVTNLASAVAVDYLIKDNLIVWSDVHSEKIFRCTIGNYTTQKCKHPIVEDGVHTPDGIAVDWVHHLLYWTDAGMDTISVIQLDGSNRRTLFNTNLHEPRAIAIDPRKGVMFWSDWGRHAKIEISGMDGTHRLAIVTSNIMWPNGLAVDPLEDRIYWADAKLQALSSSNYLGTDRQVVLHSFDQLKHPFSVAVFEDKVYWTDWETEGVHAADKFTGKNAKPVVRGLTGLMTIKVYHKVLQPEVPNKCLYNRCSHLCLPSPQISFNASADKTAVKKEFFRTYKCYCPDGLSLLEDARTCQGVESEAMAATRQTGRLAGTVIGFLVLLSLILAVIGWMFWRHLSSAPSRAFSFDNPVYRKTTEEVCSAESSQYHPASVYPHAMSHSLTEPLTRDDPDII